MAIMFWLTLVFSLVTIGFYAGYCWGVRISLAALSIIIGAKQIRFIVDKHDVPGMIFVFEAWNGQEMVEKRCWLKEKYLDISQNLSLLLATQRLANRHSRQPVVPGIPAGQRRGGQESLLREQGQAGPARSRAPQAHPR